MKKAGSIVHIIYIILKEKNMVNEYFTAKDIVTGIDENSLLQNNIINFFVKKSEKDFPITLKSETRLTNWLQMHVDQKEIFWFKRKNNYFIFKQELTERLNKEQIEMKFSNKRQEEKVVQSTEVWKK